jgi:hypothetical protein
MSAHTEILVKGDWIAVREPPGDIVVAIRNAGNPLQIHDAQNAEEWVHVTELETGDKLLLRPGIIDGISEIQDSELAEKASDAD